MRVKRLNFACLRYFLILTLAPLNMWAQDTFADNFNTISYSNNDGTLNWNTNWIESGDTNSGPTAQYIQILGGELQFFNLSSESIRRTADLTGAISATLSFDWETISLNGGRELSIQISSNGGASYTTIGTFTGNTTGSFSQNILTYASNNTTIRFTNLGSGWGNNDYVRIDNLQISGTFNPILQVDDIIVNENDGTAVFTVTHLGQDAAGPFTVDYQTSDGTAVAGTDYVSNSGTISFNGTSGDTEQITISILDNNLPDGDKFFNLGFNTGSNPTVDISDTAVGTINDDEVIQNDVPLTLFEEFSGYYDYSLTGGTFRTQDNNTDPCAISATSTANGLNTPIPGTATIQKAYLIWSHGNLSADTQVTFEGQTVNATLINGYSASGGREYFGMVADVTTQIQGIADPSTNVYDLTDLDINTTSTYCTNATVLGGWSLMIFYTEPTLPAVTINMYNGFDGGQNTSSNFTLSGFFAIGSTGSKTSVLSWEGDATLANSESLEFTTASSGTNVLSGDGGQTGTNPFNSTIYDDTASPIVNITTSYGVDLDTYDVSSYIQQGETSATTTVNVGQDLVIMNSVLLKVPSNLIVGKVFEDMNYGGDAGRDMTTASGIGVSGAIVELYDNLGNLIKTVTTDSNGEYLIGGMNNGTYSVRVVNSTVKSTRGGGVTCASCVGVQTFRTDYTASAIVPVVNEVGGANPDGADTAIGVLSGAQSIATVSISNEGVVGIDFGFNFNTIVNTNEDGQGSLEQFIVNSNNLDETGLDIEANALFDPLAGDDVSIFMIPTATDPLGRIADVNFANGYFDIALTSSLSPITATNTKIDGRTQTAYSGDTNTGSIGAGGTPVGTSATLLPDFELPEIQVHENFGDIFQVQGDNVVIRNLAVFSNDNAAIIINSESVTISNNLLGVNALGVNAGNIDTSVEMVGGSVIINENYIATNTNEGININGGTSTLIQNNHITSNGDNACEDNIDIDSGSGIVIQYNLLEDTTAYGIDGLYTSGNLIITENTIRNSGTHGGSCGSYIENAGILLDGDNSSVTNNIITANNGPGIIVSGSGSSGNLISQNSMYANGISSPALGIDLVASGATADGVTLNDNGDGDAGPNGLLNFPMINAAYLASGKLTVSGWAPSGATIEVFLSDISEGTALSGSNQLGLSIDYGEGQTYLGTITEGSAADVDSNVSSYTDADGNTDNTNRFQITIPVPSGTTMAIGSSITATATLSNSTSEFSPLSIIRAYSVITNRQITYRVNKN